MKFELQALPYEMNALEPHISGQTVNFHYNRHHRGYLDKLEKTLAGTAAAESTLEEIILNSNDDVFNNAAQVWNHTFYWNSMSPEGGGDPSREFAELLKRDVGGIDEFRRNFAELASSQFGSGWAWLVVDSDGRLNLVKTPNAQSPLSDGVYPLLTLDVWEHAYYLDYQNERGAYIEAYLDHLINWRFAETNLDQAMAFEREAATA
jgi:Fe-Mn family superoxide dismutase